MTNLHESHSRTSDFFCKLVTCIAFGEETSKIYTSETYMVTGKVTVLSILRGWTLRIECSLEYTCPELCWSDGFGTTECEPSRPVTVVSFLVFCAADCLLR